MSIAVATIVFAFFSLDVAAQDPGRFGRWLSEDAGAFVRQVGPRLPLFAAGGAAFLLPTSNFDQNGLDRIRAGYQGTWGNYLNVTNELGGPLVLIPLIGIFEASLFAGNERFQDAAFTSLQSWLFAGTLSTLFKFAFGRYRPNTGSSPDHVDMFSGHSSFPSGHTTAAFAVFTPWVLYYPKVATYGLFVLSASTGIARIALNKHWPTDVIAGATLGFFTARWLVKRHSGAGSSPRSTITPIVGPEAAGVQFSYRFR
ncbi:MAG: hypothetical protein BMS9Abin05_1860 [Rhodothermia bacterium]|nr:MAG: hypothetical protein BMS9Abin05_1860 [Rhodothermia bacterium]